MCACVFVCIISYLVDLYHVGQFFSQFIHFVRLGTSNMGTLTSGRERGMWTLSGVQAQPQSRKIRLLGAPAPRPPQLPPTQWTWSQALSLPFFCAAAVTPFSTTRGRCCLLPPPTPGAALPVFTCRGKQRARSSRERRLPTTRLWRPYQLLTTRTRKQHMPSNQSRVTFFSLQKRQTEHEDGPFLFFIRLG